MKTEYVQECLDGAFTLEPEVLGKLNYLSLLANNFMENPYFKSNPTSHKPGAWESGLAIEQSRFELVRAFFLLLEDSLYDAKTKWWSREENEWALKASYLFWAPRTSSKWALDNINWDTAKTASRPILDNEDDLIKMIQTSKRV